MNDKYTNEIREIRNRQYEETKDMTPQELDVYTNGKISEIMQQLTVKPSQDTPELEKSGRN